jgi:hypothetical protein
MSEFKYAPCGNHSDAYGQDTCAHCHVVALQAENAIATAAWRHSEAELDRIKTLAQAVVDEDEIGREIPYSEGLSDAIDNLAAALEGD